MAEMTIDGIALDCDIADLAAIDFAEEVGERQTSLGAPIRGRLKHVKERDQQQADDHPKREIFSEVHCLSPILTALGTD